MLSRTLVMLTLLTAALAVSQSQTTTLGTKGTTGIISRKLVSRTKVKKSRKTHAALQSQLQQIRGNMQQQYAEMRQQIADLKQQLNQSRQQITQTRHSVAAAAQQRIKLSGPASRLCQQATRNEQRRSAAFPVAPGPGPD